MDSPSRSDFHPLVRSYTGRIPMQARPRSQPRCLRLSQSRSTPDLPGSWRVHPIPLPRSRTPAGPNRPRHHGQLGAVHTFWTVNTPAFREISRLNDAALVSAAYASRDMSPRPMQGSLPAGGWPLPDGSRTHWTLSTSFSYSHSILSSQACPGATTKLPQATVHFATPVRASSAPSRWVLRV